MRNITTSLFALFTTFALLLFVPDEALSQTKRKKKSVRSSVSKTIKPKVAETPRPDLRIQYQVVRSGILRFEYLNITNRDTRPVIIRKVIINGEYEATEDVLKSKSAVISLPVELTIGDHFGAIIGDYSKEVIFATIETSAGNYAFKIEN